MPDSSEIQKKILSGRGLAVERGERILFSGLDFDIEAGTLWQVAGHNGCGKTTLLRGLIGLSSSVQGELFWRGQPVARCRPQMFADCLYFGHHPAVKLMLSARENLQWWQALYEQRDDAAIDLALEQLGLFGYQEVLCGNMSAGQQRRVALARLYLSKASLWILDEPFTAIDWRGVGALEALFEQHVEKGGAIVLTSHQKLKNADLHILDLEAYQ